MSYRSLHIDCVNAQALVSKGLRVEDVARLKNDITLRKPYHNECHGRISDSRPCVYMVARRIRYRAMYVQESNPVVGSIDRM